MKRKQTTRKQSSQSQSIRQDGVLCPRKPPWDPRVSRVTGLPFMVILILGIYLLLRAGILPLVIWLLAYAIFSYPLRYFVCARCPYYGMDCSSSYGKLVPKMFKKQEGKSMLLGLWFDVVFLTFLFVFPLIYIKNLVLIIVWCGVFVMAFVVLSRLACAVCPLTFCPIGKGGRAFWRLFNTSL
jgi:hypothetical protein